MIASYIKFFTRSVNGWLFGFSAFVAGCMKSLVVLSTQYSIGLMLTLLGYREASLAIVAYLNSVSEVTFAAIIIHIIVFTLFTWYYMNSSSDPVVRVKQYAKDQCQLENLRTQVSELKEKSGLETKEKKEVESKYEKEKAKSEKTSKENKTLKEKVEENKKDKKKISDLEESIKERDNEIEIKACNLDKLQLTLEASKEDVERSKSELKELETKYMSSLKELDVKDSQISDLEDGEKELQSQMSDKNKEIEEKELLVEELHEKIASLEKQLLDLENDLEEEKKLSLSIRMEKDLLEQTSANITEYMSTKKSETTESEADDEDSEKAVEKLQAERLAMLTDATKIKGELSETKSELASCKEELAEYVEKSAMLEGKYSDLEAKFDSLCEKTKKLKETIERKDIEIATITKFFSDRENELQTTTLKQSEEIQKLTKQLGLIGDDRRQITELNKQITDLKEEMASNEKNFKHQVSVLEEESHANYLKMRTSTRESEEHKREKEIYRKKLLENETKPLNQSNTSLSASLDMSDRSESPGSNKSMEEKAKDAHTYPPTSGTAVRPGMPFHPPPLFRGMPPRFPPRPPMGTPPFLPMPPRLPYTGPPRPFMPMMRNPPPNTQTNNSRQATPGNQNTRYPTPNNMGHQIPNPAVGYQQTPPQNNVSVSGATPSGASFNGQEYVNTLIDNLATKDNIRKDLFEKQNKSVL